MYKAMKKSNKNIIVFGSLAAAMLFLSKTAAAKNTPIPSGGGNASTWAGYGTYKGSNGSIDESYLGMKTVRGIRNNNCGNIKTNAFSNPSYNYWLKELKKEDNTDGVFCQFESFPYGLRAMIKLLRTYKSNHGINTIDALISRYDTPTAQHYKDFVSSQTSISTTAIIDLHDKETLKKIIVAMVKLECAGFTISSAQFETAYSLI